MKKKMLSIMLVLVMLFTAFLNGVETTFATEYEGWQEGLELAEGDTIVIDGESYAYGGDAGAGLQLESGAGPDVNTIWTAGDGYVLFHYEGVGALRVVTITLHNATIEKRGSFNVDALQLPIYYSVNMILEGENFITSEGDGIDNQYGANTMPFVISGEGSLDIKAEENGLCILRPTVLKSGTVRVEATDDGAAIFSQNAESTFTMEGGTLIAKTGEKLSYAYESLHAGATITGGTAIFENTAGGCAFSFDGAESGKLSVSNAKVDVTGAVSLHVAGEVTGIADISQYVDIADTATGTITELSVMAVDDLNKYATYDLEGTLTKTGAITYNFNLEGAYDEDATLEADGYEIEWVYDETMVKTGYKLTIGKALSAALCLPEDLSGTVVVAEDIEFKDVLSPTVISKYGMPYSDAEPQTVVITGPGSIKTDGAFADFLATNVIIREISVTAAEGVAVMMGNATIEDAELNIVGTGDVLGIGVQDGGLEITNSELYMVNVTNGIVAFGNDTEIKDSKITIICREDEQTCGIRVDGGSLEINNSVVSITKAKGGIYVYTSNDTAQFMIKDSNVVIEAEEIALMSGCDIVIDHSDVNLQASGESGIAVISETGVTILNSSNMDAKAGSLDTGEGNIKYFILLDGKPVKAVEIKALDVSELVVEKTKTEYKVGDTLNLDDITVTAKYNDGTSHVVTGYTTNASTLDMSVAGDKTLTVSYTENGKTVTKDITITVAAKTIVGAGDLNVNTYTVLLMCAAVALIAVCAKKRFAK